VLLQPAILQPRWRCIGDNIVVLNLHDPVEKLYIL
jgi:hypothetical protein